MTNSKKPLVLADVELQRLCDVFMRLVADHGTFHRKQILAYIAGRRGGGLTQHEESDVIAYVESCGAKRGWEKKPDLLHFLPKPVRRPLPKGKRDKRTMDLFSDRTGA
jgi:hypothetical protein